MRITMARTASPSTAHRPCLITNRSGWSKRSRATRAEALNTITTLTQTRKKVAVKSTRSDLSLRATLRPLLTDPPPTDNHPGDRLRSRSPREAARVLAYGEEPSAVISRLVGQATDLADWG